ncbi:hypothetical protein MVEG_10491 [Podila verticillata NRRL 6337]|nr:hypothetical protein MVEG_10491 [Podila verticillata NRRL 6337]
MTPPAQTDPPVYQKFEAEGGSSLRSLSSYHCAETDERYLLWTDIQHAFNGIDHLKHTWGDRVLFTIDAAGELTFHEDQAEEFNNGQVNTQDQQLDEIAPSLKHLFDMCIYSYNHLKSVTRSRREYFRQAVVNTRYYHSMVVEELERLDNGGVRYLVDGKDRGQLLEVLHDLQKKVPEWEYRNICYNTLHDQRHKYDSATSVLFIVLPSDLDSWNDLDPSTHRFHLYYMCDNLNLKTAQEDLPQHVHLSNHPGYRLKQPEEFFQKYGDYILRMLQMVKHGYTENGYDIPSLDTLKILWNCDSNIIGSRLAMDIEPLVDRAISYLQELSLRKWNRRLGLNRDQSAAIKTYLDVQDGDSAKTNLCRCISKERCIYWKCEAHAHQSLSCQSLEHLKEFVNCHGGHFNMQQARIKVELGSIDEVDQFQTRLCNAKHAFDISIKLCWEATRSVVRKLCLDIANTGTVLLELDGITLDIHPQGYDQYRNNLFHDVILTSGLRFISLLNYPRFQERCVHMDRYSLQLENSPVQLSHDWMALLSDLMMFHNVILQAQDPSEWKSAATKLQTALEKHELSGTYMVTIYNNTWNAVFDQKRGVAVEVHSEDMVCPKNVLSAGSIRTLGVHLNSLDFEQELLDIMETNTELQDLIISYYGHDILNHMEHIVQMWHTSSRPFRLTLLDRVKDTHGRVVAQLAVRGCDMEDPSDGTTDLHTGDISPPFSHEQAMHEFTDVVFTQWDCDHVFSKISNYSASFLDMASRQHPSVLTLLTLDVSCLSRDGLSSIREVLRRSYLEHLHVVCTPVNSQSESIAQVLGCIQWSTLKSLVLAGYHIEAWIDLCQPPSPVCLSLLSFQIQGTLPNIQELSHSNVLFIIQLICASPMLELCFQNVQLQESRDWELIVDSMDYSWLKMLDLDAACIGQLVSMPDAANLFISRVGQAREDTELAKLVLRALTLDITILSEPDLVAVQAILSVCRLEELRIECPPFDSRLSASFAQVLASVHWTSLEHLDLTGDNINEWIQLLPNIETPQLQSLGIQGSECVEQTLVHSSVLFVEQRICASSLVELTIGHIQLQDRLDWVRLVENMDPSLVEKGFSVRGRSHKQFVGTPEAVQLEQEKKTQWEGMQ